MKRGWRERGAAVEGVRFPALHGRASLKLVLLVAGIALLARVFPPFTGGPH